MKKELWVVILLGLVGCGDDEQPGMLDMARAADLRAGAIDAGGADVIDMGGGVDAASCGSCKGGVSCFHGSNCPLEFKKIGEHLYPSAINASSVVAGTFRYGGIYTSRPFVWNEKDGTKLLPLRSGDITGTAEGINAAGDVVGTSYSKETDSGYPGGGEAVLWSASKGLIQLGTLGGKTSAANGINNLGEIVGRADDGKTGDWLPFIWTQSGGMQPIGNVEYGIAYAINNHSEVVGWVESGSYKGAFFWSKATGMKLLGSLLGMDECTAYSINDASQVVGMCSPSYPAERAFIWTAAGGMKEVVGVPGSRTWAKTVNDIGQIVGGTDTTTACLWDPKEGFFWLKNLLLNDDLKYSEVGAINGPHIVGHALIYTDTVNYTLIAFLANLHN